jgi:hypothetical protein
MLLSFVFPLTFVVLWASAFATGSVATQDATPFAALAFRFALVAIGFVVVAWYLAEFSKLKMQDLKHSIITGFIISWSVLRWLLVLLQCGYSSRRIRLDCLYAADFDRNLRWPVAW